MLLRERADKDKARNNGTIALLIACGEGHEAAVRLLVEQGANKEEDLEVSNSGWTPLLTTCQGRTGTARLLLDQGATCNKEAAANDGTTPMLAACRTHISC